MRGIDAAVCAGIVAGAADKQLEVISAVTDEQIGQIRQLRETLPVRVELADTQHIFDVCVTLRSRGHTASVRIVDYHTNIVRKELDGRSLFEKAASAAAGAEQAGEERTDRSCLSVEQIYRFASEVPLERLKPVLARQAEYNMAIAEEGLRNPYGANIGKVLLKRADATGDVRLKARAYAAAGSDARMNGCEMPVVIVSGSGNQGLTASVPVIVYARELGKSEEEMYPRARPVRPHHHPSKDGHRHAVRLLRRRFGGRRRGRGDRLSVWRGAERDRAYRRQRGRHRLRHDLRRREGFLRRQDLAGGGRRHPRL